MANLDYDLNDFEETQNEFTPLPAGTYHCEVFKCELKESKSGGKYLSMGFKVLTGAFENRVIFGMFTTHNTNPVAQNIGRSQVAKLIEACNYKTKPNEDSAFIGGVCMVKINVKVDNYNGQTRDKNNVVSFYPVTNSTPANIPAAHVVAGASTNPFGRKAV